MLSSGFLIEGTSSTMRSRQSWTRSILILILMICSLASAGCLTRTKILYARATRLPEETKGLMRLAVDHVEVNVIGDDGIGIFSTVNPGGYVLIHEQDLAAFVRAVKELKQLKAERSP